MPQQSMTGKTLPEQAAETIRNYIRDQHLTVGDKLPNEFQLAEICEVGRSSIREAIKILVFEGLVEVVRGSGTFILEQKIQQPDDPMGFQEFADGKDLTKQALEFLDVRLMLEPEVAALAAQNANYKDCQKLKEAEEAVRRCILAGEDHLPADVQFHLQIARCSRNSIVCNLMEIIVKGVLVFGEVTKKSMTKETLSYHREILEAITSGDAIGARCSMIGHLNHNRKFILKEMEKTANKEDV